MGGTLSDENAKRVGIDPRGLHEGGSSGGGNISLIDLGIIRGADVLNAGGILQLLPYTEGVLFGKITFSPDNYVEDLSGMTFQIGTPNTLDTYNERRLAIFNSDASPPAQDTDESNYNTSGTILTKTPGVPAGNYTIRDSGPLLVVATNGSSGQPAFYPVTWQPNTKYSQDSYLPAEGQIWKVYIGGTSGLELPDFSDPNNPVTDGTVAWTAITPQDTTASIHAFIETISSPGTLIPRLTSIEFIQQPTNTVAGETISPAVTVRVLDQDGQPYTFAPIGISVYILGAGTLSGGGPSGAYFTDQTTGIATLDSLSIAEAGVNYVICVDVSLDAPGISRVSSDPFDVTAP